MLIWLGLGVSGIAFSAVPLAAAWLALSLWLGRRYVRMQDKPSPGRTGDQDAALAGASAPEPHTLARPSKRHHGKRSLP